MAILKTSSGNFQARYQGDDGRMLTKVFLTKREAQAQEIEWKRQKSDGALGNNTDRYRTLNEYFNEWYENAVEETPIERRSGWRKGQFSLYRDYVNPLLGKQYLIDIKPIHIKKVLVEMAKKGKSDQTRLHVYSMLKKIFGDASEVYQYLSFNPVIRTLRPVVITKEARHMNLEQMKRLLEYVLDKEYGLAIWLGLYMGLRIGELEALQWQDVDLETGKIYVRRAWVRKMRVIRDYPKGRKQHNHQMPKELWEMLLDAKRNSTSDFVVTALNGKTMLPYKQYLKALKTYCKELELPLIGIHGLRHSTSELYLSHGARKEDIQALFAHSSMDVTERYMHGRNSNLEKVSNVIQLFQTASTINRPFSNEASLKEKDMLA